MSWWIYTPIRFLSRVVRRRITLMRLWLMPSQIEVGWSGGLRWVLLFHFLVSLVAIGYFCSSRIIILMMYCISIAPYDSFL